MRISLALPALLATCCALVACTLEPSDIPQIPVVDTLGNESASLSSASGAVSSSADIPETAAEPAATTIESLEVPGASPSAITGHLIISTIGFGNTPDQGGPPRLLEFFDYDCEYCRQHAREERPWIDEKYVASGKLAIERVFLSFTPQGKRMDQAALCAASQNAFTEMDAFLMTSVPRTDTAIFTFAKTLKQLDQARFTTCMENMAVAEGRYDIPGGQPVTRTPAFILGNARWEGILSRMELEKTIDAALRK